MIEKFGVAPDRVVDVQALAGDSVDNIPGAPGIGVKTAALLINEYGDLDSLLARAEEIKQPKRRQTLIDHADQIRMSRKLVLLDENTPLDFSLTDLEVRDPDPTALVDFLNQMEFRTPTRRVADKFGTEPPAPPDPAPEKAKPQADTPDLSAAQYDCIRDLDTLNTWIDRIRKRGYVAVDTETTSLDEMRAKLVGISLCVDAGHAAYIPLAHCAGGDDLFGASALLDGQIPLDHALNALKPVLEDTAILKIGQNMKYDAKDLRKSWRHRRPD